MKSLEKTYFSIKEVAIEIGESEPTIRYWEKEFHELKPRKTPGGTRFFTKENIELLKRIKFLLREQKLTIAGAKKRLKNKYADDTDKTKQVLLEKLEFIKKELNDLIKQMAEPEDLNKYNS